MNCPACQLPIKGPTRECPHCHTGFPFDMDWPSEKEPAGPARPRSRVTQAEHTCHQCGRALDEHNETYLSVLVVPPGRLVIISYRYCYLCLPKVLKQLNLPFPEETLLQP